MDWADTAHQLTGSPAAFSHGVSTTWVTFTAAYTKDRITATDGSISSVSHPFTIN